MKNLKINCILLALAMGFLFSCEEQLDLTNPNELSSGSFWKNLSDTQKGLASTYQALLHHDILQLENEAMRADEGWPGFGRPLGSVIRLPFYDLNYTNSSSFAQNRWLAIYKAIFRANQVIEALEDIKDNYTDEVNIQVWTNQMAEARFIRGLMHFYLHSTYNNGSVIIRDFVPQSREEFNLPLSTANEVQDFFRQDLEYAYNNLPTRYENVFAGRATRGAAAVNLGKSYLFEKDYATAITYFDDIINNVTADYNYSLVTDLDIFFTSKGDFTSESIFELNYTMEHRQEISVWWAEALTNRYALLTVDSNGPLLPSWLISAYQEDEMDPLDDRNYYDDPDTGRTLKPVNLRALTFAALPVDGVTTTYGETTGAYWATSDNGWGFGRTKKYTNHDLNEEAEGDPADRGRRASGKNVILDRLANVYLMQAECMIKTGDVTGALELINTLRHRWALVLLGSPNPRWSSASFDNFNYTAESLMEHLMYKEKPLEMCLEGYQTRWTDLRRWGVTKANFDRLASETFYVRRISVKNIEGNNVGKLSVSSEFNPDAAGLWIVDYEYDTKAQNYDPGNHDYVPIPLNEITGNPNIFN